MRRFRLTGEHCGDLAITCEGNIDDEIVPGHARDLK